MAKTDLKAKGLDERMAYVVKHPVRVDALAIFNERTASIAEVAAIMGLEPTKITHHVKDLFDAGCIELVRTEQRRGAQEHYYCASLRPNISLEIWETMTLEERREISALMFQAIVAEGSAALRVGTFDSRKNRHVSWRILSLDEEGWEELVEEKAESLNKTEEIQARAYHRMTKSGEEGVSVIAVGMAFERARTWRSAGHRRID